MAVFEHKTYKVLLHSRVFYRCATTAAQLYIKLGLDGIFHIKYVILVQGYVR